MDIDELQDAELLEICSTFPSAPIEDDDSYRAAIEILDRLFKRGDLHSPVELEYFRTLAQMASDYEMTVLRNLPSGKENNHATADHARPGRPR